MVLGSKSKSGDVGSSIAERSLLSSAYYELAKLFAPSSLLMFKKSSLNADPHR